jgi:hypothetical protein
MLTGLRTAHMFTVPGEHHSVDDAGPVLSGELWLRVDAGGYSVHRSVKQGSWAHALPCDSRRGKYRHSCD